MDPILAVSVTSVDDYVTVDSPPPPDLTNLVQSINSEINADDVADHADVASGYGDDVADNEGGREVVDDVTDDGEGGGVDVAYDADVAENEEGGEVVYDVADESADVAYEGEGDEASEEEGWELPEEMRRNVVELRCGTEAEESGECRVYLVGTAHVSKESCDEVQAVINFLKPEAVFLELCSSRVNLLKPQDLKVPTMKEMVDMWKKQHNLFGILYSWFLAKVASHLDVFPGAEFRVAYEEAMKYGGKVVLGDRPVQITLRRTWLKLPRWHKIKLISSLLCQSVFLPSPQEMNRMLKEFDDDDMLTLVIKEMSKKYPTLMETIVHERDLYMSSTLWRLASAHNTVVAVVGKGHLQGIKKNWMKPVELEGILDVDNLSAKKSVSVVKILTTIGVVGVGAAIISGIYISSKK